MGFNVISAKMMLTILFFSFGGCVTSSFVFACDASFFASVEELMQEVKEAQNLRVQLETDRFCLSAGPGRAAVWRRLQTVEVRERWAQRALSQKVGFAISNCSRSVSEILIEKVYGSSD